MNSLKYILSIAVPAILLSSCQTEVKKEEPIRTYEYLKITAVIDTGNYITSLIPSVNPEVKDVLEVQYRLKIMNVTVNPTQVDTIVIDKLIIIENPDEDAASYSYGFEDNPNGLYDESGKRITFPVNLLLYDPLNCILKHGQTIDKATMDFIKGKFKDISKLNSKEVFKALIENGMNLQNDKTMQGEIMQLEFYTTKDNIIYKDILFPYNNYCVK